MEAYKPSEAKAALASLSPEALEIPSRLEVPLGELARGFAPTLLLLGPGKTKPDFIEDLTGKERFSAQGLEGKAVMLRPLGQALAALSFLPQFRGRVLVDPKAYTGRTPQTAIHKTRIRHRVNKQPIAQVSSKETRMATAKKIRVTRTTFSGRKSTSDLQVSPPSKAAKEVLSKTEYLRREKAQKKVRRARAESDDGYLNLARAIIAGGKRPRKAAKKSGPKQRNPQRKHPIHGKDDPLTGLCRAINGPHPCPRIQQEAIDRPRSRPVNPKLYKMSDGVTQSLLHSFLACRRQIQYTLRGWRPATSKAAMTYGSIFHDLLEHYYVGIMAGKIDRDFPFQRFARKHTRAWIKKNGKNLRHAGDLKMAFHEAAKVSAVFPSYCRFHDEDFDELDWQALEGVFDVNWRSFRLKGRWDGLYRIARELWLLETKTKSRIDTESIKSMLAFDFQSLFYITALAEKRKKKVEGVRYNVIRNPSLRQGVKESTRQFIRRIEKDAEARKDFYFMRFEASFDKSTRSEFEVELMHILREMRDWLDGRLATYKNGGSCIRRYTCEYMSACASGTMAGYLGGGKLFTELE